ncbi:hypothetical protein FJTKL_02904 [Diaporthe vaccinii]|uniref:Uncharacterized protein n=1 Tax=Diaporthe vaccinii TaxID=105482 RepID=A0ABR4F317_9PEZI
MRSRENNHSQLKHYFEEARKSRTVAGVCSTEHTVDYYRRTSLESAQCRDPPKSNHLVNLNAERDAERVRAGHGLRIRWKMSNRLLAGRW